MIWTSHTFGRHYAVVSWNAHLESVTQTGGVNKQL